MSDPIVAALIAVGGTIAPKVFDLAVDRWRKRKRPGATIPPVPDAHHAALDLAALCQPWTPQTFHARRPGDAAALCGQAETLWNTVRRSCVNCAGCLAEIQRRLAEQKERQRPPHALR